MDDQPDFINPETLRKRNLLKKLWNNVRQDLVKNVNEYVKKEQKLS
ncbi:14237_t:CDS:2 [Funneliformis geosporum]|nr:14237_t:CDS:2 [Funneliformis geosporum]